MENLNAEQVKKDLQNIVDNYSGSWTRFNILSNALALINSQEQRIGELEKRLRYLLQSKTIAEYDEVDINTKEYVKDIHSLDANIEHLTKELTRKGTEYNELYELCESYRIERDAMRGAANSYKMYSKTLEKENETLKTLLDESYDGQNSVRADTVRKMQERLDKRFCHDPAFLGVEQRLIMDVIDQIAKEIANE